MGDSDGALTGADIELLQKEFGSIRLIAVHRMP